MSSHYICPADQAALVDSEHGLVCARCGAVYPVVGGVPILIDDANSVFSRSDYLSEAVYEGASYGSDTDRTAGWRRAYRRFAHALSNSAVFLPHLDADAAVARMRALKPGGSLLVVGSGDTGYGGDGVTYTDVAFGRNVTCIADAHSLPFPDAHFDGVLMVAVLEHVADPVRCVDEVRRVLRPDGHVYAVTPFLQPVHMGAHDFTRFTYLGHRRLFRWFAEVEGGAVLGPATSLAFALQHVLLCVSDRHAVRRVMRLLGLMVAVPIKQLDRLFARRAGALDAAAGVYLFGRLRAQPYTDKEIIAMYRGAQR
jgi:SAM-dependent methyltransferase